jgi:hypothetical protein
MQVDKIEEVRVSRSRIIEYLKEDFFEEFILDMFVRVHTKNQAMLAQVKGVKEGKEYEVDTGIGHEANFKTRKHLVCAHSTSIQPFPITVMSNKPLDKENVYTWCKNMSRENKDLPDEDDLQVKLCHAAVSAVALSCLLMEHGASKSGHWQLCSHDAIVSKARERPCD